MCGNYESVKFLNEWLQDWRTRGHRSSIDLSDDDDREMLDADYNAFQSDCDSEDFDEETSRKNVLLVTGPSGVTTPTSELTASSCFWMPTGVSFFGHFIL